MQNTDVLKKKKKTVPDSEVMSWGDGLNNIRLAL